MCDTELRRLREVVDAGRANAGDAGPIPPAPPPPRRRPWAGIAAAAVVLAIALVGVGLARRGPAVEATARLDALEEGAAGTAVLVSDGAGRAVRIDDSRLAAVDGYYEVWLADPALQRLVSLGPYAEGEPKRLPEGLDVGDYPVVDVSIEPLDGDPAHSGRSVLRGRLSPS